MIPLIGHFLVNCGSKVFIEVQLYSSFVGNVGNVALQVYNRNKWDVVEIHRIPPTLPKVVAEQCVNWNHLSSLNLEPNHLHVPLHQQRNHIDMNSSANWKNL